MCPPLPFRPSWRQLAVWYDAMQAAHRQLRSEGIQPHADDLVPKALSPGAMHERNMLSIVKLIVDGGATSEQVDAKMRHLVAVAVAECTRDGKLDWLNPALLWHPDKASRQLNVLLEQAAAPKWKPGERPPARSAAGGGSQRRNDRPQPTLKQFNQPAWMKNHDDAPAESPER